MDERNDLILCGRFIGTATGWDGDDLALVLYDLEPAIPEIPAGDVSFDLTRGKIEQHDEAGRLLSSIDLIEALCKCEYRQPKPPKAVDETDEPA